MSESTDAERLIREARVYDPLDLDRWQSEAEYWATLDYWPANGAIGPKTTSGLWHDCTWVVRCIRLIAENRAALAREQAAIKERDAEYERANRLNQAAIEQSKEASAYAVASCKLTEENRVLRERIEKLRGHMSAHGNVGIPACAWCQQFLRDDDIRAKLAGANDDH